MFFFFFDRQRFLLICYPLILSIALCSKVAISSCRFFYPLCIVHIDDGEGEWVIVSCK